MTQPAITDALPRNTLPKANTFAALKHRNFRLWFFGQMVSMAGTWMQWVAQSWLVYELTGSKWALGVVSFLGSLPAIFLMIPAGVVADRLPKRTVLLWVQTGMMLLAFALAGLAAAGVLQVWHIALLAFGVGICNSFDAPVRQSMIVEMVEDRRDLMNAIALNATLFNVARVIGPALGGILLAAVGAAWCFTINGFSFLAVIVALWMMRFPAFRPAEQREPLSVQIAGGLKYIRGHELVRTLIALTAVTTLFAFGYATLMPAFAADVLKVGEAGLGLLNACIGVGALLGSLLVASLGAYKRKGALLTLGNLLFPAVLLAFAASRSFALALALLFVVGFAFVLQQALVNTLLQSICPDELRGRVMGVFSLAFFGVSPFAGLQAGALAQLLGPAMGLSIGAAITLAFGLWVLIKVPALRRVEV